MDANFDWVSARSECSIGVVFRRLRDGVIADLAKRKELRKDEEVQFTLHRDDSSFVVYRETRGIVAVTFALRGHEIQVSADDDTVMLSASLTLNNAGECRLLVKGEELTEWQFRRRALEDLFFNF